MNIDGEIEPGLPEKLEQEDKWILSTFNSTAKAATENLDNFDLNLAAQKAYDFIWDESVWCIIGFVILLLHIKKKNFKGENLYLYVFWYGLGRFFIEGLRTDSLETFGGLRMSQLVALISVVVSLAILIYMNIKIKKEKSKN